MRDYAYIRETGSRVIGRKPLLVETIVLTGTGQASAEITLYDGVSDNDSEIITLSNSHNYSHVYRFAPHLKTRNGLYIKNVSGVQEYLVIYEVRGEREPEG